MTKFDRVLSNSEIHELLVLNNELLSGDSDGQVFFKADSGECIQESSTALLRRVEQAVLAKLAEQEPAVWLHPDDPTRSITKWQKDGGIKDGGAIEKTMSVFSVPAYAHPCVSFVSDKTACVSESGESDTQHLPTLPEPDVDGYKGSYSEDQMIEYAKSAIEKHRTTKNHIPDPKKIIDLSLSVDAKETQALLQSYLDGLDGWQLVPKEPTDNQIDSAMEASLRGRPSIDDETYVMSIIDAYLSAAPKHDGGGHD